MFFKKKRTDATIRELEEELYIGDTHLDYVSSAGKPIEKRQNLNYGRR